MAEPQKEKVAPAERIPPTGNQIPQEDRDEGRDHNEPGDGESGA
jgi:hypothetical protein